VFLTLTFHGLPDAIEAKRALKAFLMRVRRKFPNASGIWRMEPQERGSWHFHLLFFNLPYWSQRQIQYAWECCTREDQSIVHVKLLRGGKRQAMYYVAKYMAQVEKHAVSPTSLDTAVYQHDQESDITDDPGRFWGYINKKMLPFARLRQIRFDDNEIDGCLWFEIKKLSRGYGAQQDMTARLYGTCCYDLAERLIKTANKILYDITHHDGSKIQWYEVDHSLAFA
jgi:hypothetical protein